MIWPNLRIGWPLEIGTTATLWPFGHPLKSDHPVGQGDALVDDVDGDDDVVARVEAKGPGQPWNDGHYGWVRV